MPFGPGPGNSSISGVHLERHEPACLQHLGEGEQGQVPRIKGYVGYELPDGGDRLIHGIIGFEDADGGIHPNDGVHRSVDR